jgi:hypothetical protein|tara:strand:- start:211 stop:387 length:177 start_codon:yes stop_codon:yes gene_type:complete
MVKQKMFVAKYMLFNGVSKEAYFTSNREAMKWVTEANSSNLLESFIIDNRDVGMEEFL